MKKLLTITTILSVSFAQHVPFEIKKSSKAVSYIQSKTMPPQSYVPSFKDKMKSFNYNSLSQGLSNYTHKLINFTKNTYFNYQKEIHYTLCALAAGSLAYFAEKSLYNYGYSSHFNARVNNNKKDTPVAPNPTVSVPTTQSTETYIKVNTPEGLSELNSQLNSPNLKDLNLVINCKVPTNETINFENLKNLEKLTINSPFHRTPIDLSNNREIKDFTLISSFFKSDLKLPQNHFYQLTLSNPVNYSQDNLQVPCSDSYNFMLGAFDGLLNFTECPKETNNFSKVKFPHLINAPKATVLLPISYKNHPQFNSIHAKEIVYY